MKSGYQGNKGKSVWYANLILLFANLCLRSESVYHAFVT